MTAEIRRARPGEETAVSRLLAEVWHATHDTQLGRDKVAEITAKWHAPALLRTQIGDEQKSFLVAEADGGLLGHADSKTTQRYAHLGSDPLRRASEAISSEISAAMTKVSAGAPANG